MNLEKLSREELLDYVVQLERQYKNELEEAEKTAEEGYEQAYQIIVDLQDKLTMKPEEFVFDWNSALGDTIRERFESLYVFLVETVLPKVGDRAFIIASLEFSSLFETCTCSWEPDGADGDDPVRMVRRNINDKFSLFKTNNLAADTAYIFGKKRQAIIRIKYFEI